MQSDVVIAEQSVIDARTGNKVIVAKPERISAIISSDIDNDVRLFAPDGSLIIGEDGLVDIGENERLIEIQGQTLAVTYTDLNEKLRFLSVKSMEGLPLSQGEWIMKPANMPGEDMDTKIKYYTSYDKIELPSLS
jgi:hypothetical protein